MSSDNISRLIDRIEAHEAEGAAILVSTDELSLDAKKIKAIRRAKADAAAAKKTLDTLMGAGLMSELARATIESDPS